MKSENTDSIIDSPSTPTTPVYIVYPQRFYVLAVFSFLSFNQCLMWLTFSPIARSAEVYYNITDSTIDLLLNWGPIQFIPFLPITYMLLNTRHGLRRCVILLAILAFGAGLVRVIPMIITSPTSSNFGSISLPFLHAGQILNAICGPLVMAPVSQLSCLWFAPHERTRATTIATLTHSFGTTVGFVISPFIVSSPDYVPRLLYLHLALAFLACVLALLYFPAQPPTAPSAAAELLILQPTNQQNSHSWKQFMKDIWTCLSTPSFVLIAIPAGLVCSTLGSWTSLFDLILKPENYTEQQAGWFGFGFSIAGIAGGFILGFLADTPLFRRSLKTLIVITSIAALLAIIWFELSVHTYFYNQPILPSTAATIGLSVALVGLFASAAFPLIYEALAEIMFPLPESLSASILVQWNNVVSLVLLFIAPGRDKLMNLLVLIIMVLSILMFIFARFSYKRRDEDERKQLEKEQEQIVTHADLNGQINESRYGTFI